MYGFDNPASRPKRDHSVQPCNFTCSLNSQLYEFRHSPLPRRHRDRATQCAVDRRSNKDAYKPALGSRVDDTLSTIPQKGPSLDMGSAKMVGFYGVLAAAVAAALAFQG